MKLISLMLLIIRTGQKCSNKFLSVLWNIFWSFHLTVFFHSLGMVKEQ